MINWEETDIIWEYYIRLNILWRYCWDNYIDIEWSDTMILNISWWSSNQAPTDITIYSDNINEANNIWDPVWSFSTVDPDDPSQVGLYEYYLVLGIWDDDNSSFFHRVLFILFKAYIICGFGSCYQQTELMLIHSLLMRVSNWYIRKMI